MADEEPDWSTVVVPDDAAELDADELALRRERAARRRRDRMRRLTGADRFRAHGVTASVVIVAFGAVAVFGGLLVLLGPRTHGTPATPPPGPAPTAATGTPGGLLPDLEVSQADGATVDIRALGTPAALLVVPAGCDCTRTLTTVGDAAVRDDLRVAVIEPAHGGSPTDSAGVSTYTDGSGRLLQTYGALGTAPTLVVVDASGAVRSVEVGLSSRSASALLTAGLAG